MVFAGRDRQVSTELRGTLWAALGRGHDDEMYMYNQQGVQYRAYQGSRDTTEKAPFIIEGAWPGHFLVTQSVRQWQPELSRMLSLEPLATKAPVLSLPERGPQNVQVLTQKVQAALRQQNFNKCDTYALFWGTAGSVASNGFLPQELVYKLCKQENRGLFAAVSQVSPTGGSDFEDAPLLDSSAPEDCLIVAVMQDGDDIIMYRRLFHGN